MKIMQITKQGDSFVLSDSNGAVAAFGFPDLNAAINGAKIYGANIVYVVEVNDNIDDRIRYDWGMDFGNIDDRIRHDWGVECKMDFSNIASYSCAPAIPTETLSLADYLQQVSDAALAAKREAERLLSAEEPLRKLIGHLQENPPRIHHPSLRALVDLL